MKRVAAVARQIITPQSASSGPKLPGMLANPDWKMEEDERLGPRFTAVFPPPPEIPVDATLDEMASFVCNMDAMILPFTAVGPPAAVEARVERMEWTITATDGHQIQMQMLRPKGTEKEALPCIYHVHGGGMALMSAWDPMVYNHKACVSAEGVVVVSVEFRNSAGGRVYGPDAPRSPFPTGINDAMAGLVHIHENKARYGISTIITNGESGGGNLACALALLAKRQGRIELIDGVFACCPFIHGDRRTVPAECVSFWELTPADARDPDKPHLGDCFVDLYTPVGSPNRTNPVAWPLRATEEDLKGLPPHVISNNECDTLRDEGMEYYRRLRRARVPARAVILAGTHHGSDMGGTAAYDSLAYAGTRDALVSFARNPKMV